GSEQESEYTEEDDDDEKIKWVNTNEEEDKNDADDEKSINLENTDDEETDDEFVHSEEYVQDDDEETDDELVHGDEQVNDDEGEEMINDEDANTRNDDEEITDVAKIDAEKAEEVKDDIKKAELPPSGSSLSVSSGFDQLFIGRSNSTRDTAYPVAIRTYYTCFNSMIFEPSVVIPIPETPSVAPATIFLPPLTISSISHVLLQTTTPIPTPPITTEALPITMIPDLLHAIIQIVSVLKKDVQELKVVDNTTALHASLRSKIPITERTDDISDFATLVIQSTIKKALKKTPLLLDQSSSQAQSSLKAAESLSEYELKTILFDKIDQIRSYLTHDKHQALFEALLNSMGLDDAIASDQADPDKILTKRDRDNEDPSAGPNQGKSLAKTSKFGKSMTAEEPVEELVFEMASDDIEQTIDDVANDANQPLDDSTQTKDKDPKKY
ncbi:hypothetical protein Tco_1144462, partial [Tanacetum coccineum]